MPQRQLPNPDECHNLPYSDRRVEYNLRVHALSFLQHVLNEASIEVLNLESFRVIGGAIETKLCTFDQIVDYGILLTDERLPDGIQSQGFRSQTAGKRLTTVIRLGRRDVKLNAWMKPLPYLEWRSRTVGRLQRNWITRHAPSNNGYATMPAAQPSSGTPKSLHKRRNDADLCQDTIQDSISTLSPNMSIVAGAELWPSSSSMASCQEGLLKNVHLVHKHSCLSRTQIRSASLRTVLT